MDWRVYRKTRNGDTIVILFPDKKRIRKAGVKTNEHGEEYIFCDFNKYSINDLSIILQKYPLEADEAEYQAMIHRISLHLKKQIQHAVA